MQSIHTKSTAKLKDVHFVQIIIWILRGTCLLFPFLMLQMSEITNSKIESLYDHAKSKELQHSLPHRVMRLYMDEVRNYMEIMVEQTNNSEWTSFHY